MCLSFLYFKKKTFTMTGNIKACRIHSTYLIARMSGRFRREKGDMKMPLHEDSIRVGNQLFRWRSYLPLFFVPILISGFSEFGYPKHSNTYDLIWEMICLLISFFGFLVRCYIVSFTILEFFGDYIVTGKIIVDNVWLCLFLGGLGVYLTLRTLKKKTKLLHV
jgi:hypothetical protein